MNLFRKIENNITIIKDKKENQIKIIRTLEKIVEKIISYFNDNKFVFAIKESEENSKYNFSFLSSFAFNKELLSTLFNFDDVEINETIPYIKGSNFYDILLSSNDNYAEKQHQRTTFRLLLNGFKIWYSFEKVLSYEQVQMKEIDHG